MDGLATGAMSLGAATGDVVTAGAGGRRVRRVAGASGGMTVTINKLEVHGSVMTERDLVESLRQGLIEVFDRNGGTGIGGG